MTAEGQLIIIEFDINWIWIVFIHKEHLASFISSYVYDIYFRKARNWWGFDVRLIRADKRVCLEMSEITDLAIVPESLILQTFKSIYIGKFTLKSYPI